MDKFDGNEDFMELVERAQRGDGSAFGKIYQSFFTPVFRYVYLRVKSRAQAEDLAQTVFLKAFQSLANFKERGRPILAYLFTIARNSIIDHWRKEQRIDNEDPEETFKKIPDLEISLAEKLDHKSTIALVKHAMERLTPDQKEIVNLKFIAELSNKEISKIMGKSEEAVRQLQCRALKALRQNLKNPE